MNRFDFTPYRRNTVGFDRLFELLETTGRAAQNENYPPFNIERTGENDYKITVAVAGFKKDEITVEVDQDQLVIKGQKSETANTTTVYMHRGLSARDFVRQFTLAEHMIVNGATIQDGVLQVNIQRIVPEELKPRLIDIVEVK